MRAICRQHDGSRLAAALLELARDVTHSPTGLLGIVTDGKLLRVNALTPDLGNDLTASAHSGPRGTTFFDEKDNHISLSDWTNAWAGALLSNATVMVNVPHLLHPGRTTMKRSLAVPIAFASDMVGLFYLANKATDYSARDAQTVEQLAHWSALEVRELSDEPDANIVTVADEPTMPSVDTADWLGQKFRLLFEMAPIGMVLSELDGRLLVPNKTFLNLLAYTRDEALRLTMRELNSPASRRKQHSLLLSLTENGRFGPLEREYIRKDGVSVPVLLHGLVIKALDGTPYMWTFVQDISDAKKISSALQESRRQAEADARAKSDYISAVVEQLRGPVAQVLTHSTALQALSRSADTSGHIATVQEAGHAMARLLDDVQELSKLDSGRIHLDLIPFDLRSTVDARLAQRWDTAQARGIALRLHYDDSLPERLQGDPLRLARVLDKLLANALSLTHTGHITVSVNKLEQTDSDVIAAFEVTDTGSGIPSEKRSQVFTPFARLVPSDIKSSNTGLELAIARRSIDLLGGTLSANEVPSGGSTFRFTTRFNRVAATVVENRADVHTPKTANATPSKRTDDDNRDANRARVLVVEDNRVNQLVLVRMLERLGHRADSVANGLEAVAAMRESAYDLILMDCHMPEMDGFEATRRIRAGDAGPPNVAIVAVTAGANRARCRDVGMNDYLTKPIDPDTLGRAVDRWLSDSR